MSKAAKYHQRHRQNMTTAERKKSFLLLPFCQGPPCLYSTCRYSHESFPLPQKHGEFHLWIIFCHCWFLCAFIHFACPRGKMIVENTGWGRRFERERDATRDIEANSFFTCLCICCRCLSFFDFFKSLFCPWRPPVLSRTLLVCQGSFIPFHSIYTLLLHVHTCFVFMSLISFVVPFYFY